MVKDQELEIEIDDKTPAAEPEVEIIVDDEAAAGKTAPKTIAANEGIEELRQRLETERLARVEAEKRAREAEEQAFRAFSEVENNEKVLVNNAITSLKKDQDTLKAQLREMMSVGDYDAAADLQLRMSRNEAELMQLEHGYRQMQNAPQQRMPERGPQYEVDALINQVTPRSAEWLKRNRDSLLDSRNIRVMRRAHEDAVDHGMIPESDEYFRFVEGRLNLKQNAPRYAEEESALSSAAAPVQRRTAPPAAPVTRSASPGSNARPGVVRLTPAQAEAAKISGLTPKEYYEQMMREEARKNAN